MKNLRFLLRCLQPAAAVLTAACLAGCYAYQPAGQYGATAGTGTNGDGKGTQPAEEYLPPPVTYAPARPVYAGAGYYPYSAYYGVGYWPRYYSSHGHYGRHRYYGGHGGGHYHGGHGGSRYHGGGGHYHGRR